MGERIERGRDAFDRQAWGQAYEHLTAAARDEPLEVEDLERLASAAYLVGRSDESAAAWVWRPEDCGRLGEVARAASRALCFGSALLNGGAWARGAGWLLRGQAL